MSDGLHGLEPPLLWERFAELTRIARPSKAEELARQHVLAWAEARSLETRTDAEGNVVVAVPATAGRDGAPVIVLQAHLDMVCERDPNSPFDPREGRIDVRVEGDWVRAHGTTLGADNGIGVAAALAVVDDAAIDHGPLELLFTVSEEQGLDGAKALDGSLVAGRMLVNLDGTSDEELTVGCAGSDHTLLRLPLPTEPVEADCVVRAVELSGGLGGHSGDDIAAGRANAVKALGRVLSAAYRSVPFGVVGIDGGVSRNAIPRAARALVTVSEGGYESFRRAAEAELASILRLHRGTDDGLELSIAPAAAAGAAARSASLQALDLLAAVPTGVLALASGRSRTVETSTCLTVAETENDILTLGSMTRSSNAAALGGVLASLESLARLSGAGIEIRRSYPPWEPRGDSALVDAASASYERLFGVAPALTVVHGGIECAVLGQKLPGVDMVSIGPEIVGLHAPGEMVRISSTQRFYRLLGALLDDLSR